MKNMKIGQKEKKLLLYLGGVVIALLVYQFYFSSALDRNSQKSLENEQLNQEVQKLQELSAKQDDYETDTDSMQDDIKDILAQFPAEVKEEDAILYAKELQDHVSMTVPSVGVAEGQLVYTYGEGAATGDGTAPAETDAATADTTAEEDATAAAAGETTTYSDGADSTVEAPRPLNYMLYKVPVSIAFTAGYSNMKSCLDYIKGGDSRNVIDSLALSYDTESGNLTGTMDYGMYYLTGTDEIYTEPNIPNIGRGTTNIFGTVQ